MGAPAPVPVTQPFNPYSSPYPNNGGFQPTQPQQGFVEFPNSPYAPSPGPAFSNPPGTVPLQQTQYNMLSQPVVQDMAFQYGQQVHFVNKGSMNYLIQLLIFSWLIKENKWLNQK